MTKDELINITCKWLDYNNSKYAMQKSSGELYVCGGLQTDLRFFLNENKERDYWTVMDELYNENHKDDKK